VKRLLVLFVVALAAASAVTIAAARSSRVTATTVGVSGKEYKFILTRKTGPAGAYVFKFKNVGKVKHDFKIAGKKTPLLKPGGKATLRVTLKKGKYKYICTFPGHAALGMKGVFTVK
jgi:uncharacterized cupredoxin-like copper-binding protein